MDPLSRVYFKLCEGSTLIIMRGDVTKYQGDALVNTCNQELTKTTGTNGAIHTAAGQELTDEAARIPQIRPGLRCPTGEARMTRGYLLPVKYVFHTVSPVYETSEISEPLLTSCYRSCMQLANQHGARSIGFPAISCGVFGYPFEEGAKVAISTIQEHVGEVQEATLVIFHRRADIYEAFLRVARRLLEELPELPPPPSRPPLAPAPARTASSPAREPAVL